MAEVLRAQTGQGKLVITEEMVTLEVPAVVGGGKSRSMARAAIVSVDERVTVPSVLGMGGMMRIILRDAGGNALELDRVPAKVAKQVLALLRK